MNVLITGGAGFLGARLAQVLLTRGHLLGQEIERLVLADLFPPPSALLSNARVQPLVGSLLEQCPALRAQRMDVCFHLASAVSAECEANFDLGMRSNLDTTRALLEALRAAGNVPRFVFASSVAVFGSDPYLQLPQVVRDDTLPAPQSSYGIQKFICEQIVTDYTRKGFVDGRTARLMTVVVRPGRPNGAASGFLSGIIREPLHHEPAVCPAPIETAVALASPARAIEGLIAVAESDRDAFGGRTALNLPALTVRVGEMLEALAQVGGQTAVNYVRFVPDASVAKIVGGWPAAFDNERSKRLGLTPDPDFLSIVRQFQEDQREVPDHARHRST
jgi:nucleoside-diphosphate-sugar epimerase